MQRGVVTASALPQPALVSTGTTLCSEAVVPSNVQVCSIAGAASHDACSVCLKLSAVRVAEDSGNHQNNVLWYYDLADSKLTRILSVPYGAEVTASYFWPNIGGWSYITAVAQARPPPAPQHFAAGCNSSNATLYLVGGCIDQYVPDECV